MRKPKKKTPVKTKSKAKTKSKPKAILKSKVKKKTKLRAKPTTKKKAKVKVKIKSKSKSKIKKNTPAKKKPKAKARKYSDLQKNELLNWIEKIVNLHRGQEGGSDSFAGIDQILDKYNQHYTDASEKFDAIVKFGVEKDPRVIHEHFFVNVKDREKDVNDLYLLLAKIAKGKINYSSAKERIKAILEKSLHQ